jgi:hypothetical protein
MTLALRSKMLEDKLMVKQTVRAAKEKFSEYCTKMYLTGGRRGKAQARNLLEGPKGSAESITTDEMATHFSKLFSRASAAETLDLDANQDLLPPKVPENRELGGPPTATEVRAAIKGMSSGKAAGSDGLTAEVFKAAGEQLVSRLAQDFARIWPSEGLPNGGQSQARCEVFQSWQDAEVVCLWKGKGSRTDPGNYRGIFLLDVAGKILASIIASRLESLAEAWLSDSQCGFRKRRGTNHQIHSLRRLQTEVRRASLPTAAVFVDFEKAFDSPPRQALFECLRWIGCPPELLEVIRAIHYNPKAFVKGSESWFKVARGIRQGCVLGPIMFNILLDFCLRLADIRRHGIELVCEDKRELTCPEDIRGLEFRISDVDYADDLGLVGTDLQEMSASLGRLQAVTGRIGLNISVKKTEWMWLFPPPGDTCHAQPGVGQGTGGEVCCSRVTLDGRPVVHVRQFTYLGCLFTDTGGISDELRIRLSKARMKLNSLSFIWRSAAQLRYRKRVFMSEVVPVLLYGCETWTLTERNYQELESFMNFARLRLGNRRRLVEGTVLTNESLHRMVRLPEAAELIVPRQLTFFAGVVYKPSSLLARQMTYARVVNPVRMVSGTEKARYDNCVPAAMEFWLGRAMNLDDNGKRGRIRAFICKLGLLSDGGTEQDRQLTEDPGILLGLDCPSADLGNTGSAKEALELLGLVMAGKSPRICRHLLKAAWYCSVDRQTSAKELDRWPRILSRATGSKEQKFPCGICSLRYAEQKALNRHIKKAHGQCVPLAVEYTREKNPAQKRTRQTCGRVNLDLSATNLGELPTIVTAPVSYPEVGGCQPFSSSVFRCTVDGCVRSYRSAGWLSRHQREAHGSVPLSGETAAVTRTPAPVGVVVEVLQSPSAEPSLGREGWRPGAECPFPGCKQRGQGAGWTCWKSVQNHMSRVHHVNANTGELSRTRRVKDAPKDGR